MIHMTWHSAGNRVNRVRNGCASLLKDISEIDIAYDATNGQDKVTPDQTCFVNVPHGVTQSARVLVSNNVDLH